MAEQAKHTKSVVNDGDFGECLVGGSAEEQAGRRKIKRRAIVVSVALQTVVLAAVVIAPLLAKPMEIKTVTTMPIPPYGTPPRPHHTVPNQPPPARGWHFAQALHAPVPERPVNTQLVDPLGEVSSIPGAADPPQPVGQLNLSDMRTPVRPIEPPRTPHRVSEAHIDPALLVHRVEPVYPPLARQTRRSGKVELHAIIAADGSVRSLEAVSGDFLFVRSALDAVIQWRYKPTLLNGQAVEVDTFITVIYTLQQQ